LLGAPRDFRAPRALGDQRRLEGVVVLQRVVENTLLSLFFINSSMDVVALDKDRSGQATGLGC